MTHSDEKAESITVQIPNGLSKLIPPFLMRRHADVEALGSALECEDWTTIETIGHRMRGNGISMGFPPISTIGEAIETAAQEVDRETIETAAARLRDYLEAVDVVYV